MKIQDITIDIKKHHLDPVTYIPPHVHGDANHYDSEPGVIIRRNNTYIFVLFCRSRTVQAVNPSNLVWG